MKQCVYCIYDVISCKVASALIIADNDNVVMRDIKTAKLTPVMEENPNDFDLHYLGELDLETSELMPFKDGHRIVCHIGALKHGTDKCI